MPLLIDKHIIPFTDTRQIRASRLDSSFKNDIASFLEEWFNPEVSSITIKTSGSTGSPKTIKLPKRMMAASANKTQKYFGYHSGMNALLCLPVNYIAGKMMIVRSIMSNLILKVQNPGINPVAAIHEDIDFVAMTPHQMKICIDESRSQLDHFKIILLGGSPIHKTLETHIQHLKSDCFLSYGTTETASHVAIRKLNNENPKPYFQSMEGVYFSVDNNDCLVIEGDYLDEKIYTNDIVELIDSTSFYYKGRIDNVINSGGIKVCPENMEAQLSGITDNRFIVSSMHDETLGDRLILIIETNNSDRDIDENQLRKKIRETMKSNIKPDIIMKLPYFKYSLNGKVLRNETTKLALQTNR